MNPIKLARVLLATLLLAGATLPAHAGRIVVANDEWTLSNSGFFAPNDPGVFATNVASWFTGGGAGSFLAYSSNFGLTGSSLANAMTGAGHAWTVSTAGPQSLAALQAFDGVFLAGNAFDQTVLIDYVNAGGNVYVAAGTGNGGAAAEAARWNTFLGAFGLAFAGQYNNIGGSIAISSPHAIFAGVDHLFQDNGSSAIDIVALDPAGQVLVSQGGQGLYAVYESPAAVPAPAAGAMLAAAILTLVTRGRRRGAA